MISRSISATLMVAAVLVAGCAEPEGNATPDTGAEMKPATPQPPENTTASHEPEPAVLSRGNFSARYTPAIGASSIISREPISLSWGDQQVRIPGDGHEIQAYLNWTSVTGMEHWRLCLAPDWNRAKGACGEGPSPVLLIMEQSDISSREYEIIVEHAGGPLPVDGQTSIRVEGWYTYRPTGAQD